MSPIYQFTCKNDHTQELHLRLGSAPKKVACTNCEEYAPRVISAPAVHFKGPGFTKSHDDA